MEIKDLFNNSQGHMMLYKDLVGSHNLKCRHKKDRKLQELVVYS